MPDDGKQTPPTPGAQTPGITIDRWKETIPADIRGEKSLESIQDVTTLAKSYVNAQKLVGSKLSIPGENDDAAWNDLYGKLGRPEAADKYQVKRPEIPKELSYNEDMEKNFLQAAHKAGLNNKQANALVAWQADVMKQEVAKHQQDMKAAEETLKTEWGNTYENKVSVAKRVVAQYADQGVVDYLEKTGLGNNPAFIKFMHKLGADLIEDGAAPPADHGAGGINTKEQARAKIASMLADKEFAKRYFNNRTPGHKEAVAEIEQLHQVVYEGQAV